VQVASNICRNEETQKEANITPVRDLVKAYLTAEAYVRSNQRNMIQAGRAEQCVLHPREDCRGSEPRKCRSQCCGMMLRKKLTYSFHNRLASKKYNSINKTELL
jgi:hypothetical protein